MNLYRVNDAAMVKSKSQYVFIRPNVDKRRPFSPEVERMEGILSIDRGSLSITTSS